MPSNVGTVNYYLGFGIIEPENQGKIKESVTTFCPGADIGEASL